MLEVNKHMNRESTFNLIKSYIDDIKAYAQNHDLTPEQRLHINKAIATYISLFEEARLGKLDPDILHEHITSFTYMLQ